MKDKHEHNRSNTSVDLEKRRIKYHGKEYSYDTMDDKPTGEPGWFKRVHSDGVKTEVKSRKRQRKLESLTMKAQRRYQDRRRERDTDSDDQEQAKLTPWQKHVKQQPPDKDAEIKRSKYGIRVFSNDAKHFWDICVNRSTKYSGTSFRFFIGGKWWTSIFDLKSMEAIRREFDRGERP